ncbi:MAG: AAA family ATPase [Bacteroidetes bacterium]|nr:AAA family ATPase [Bacteroidota bacterium]
MKTYREIFQDTDFSDVFSDRSYIDDSKFYFKLFLNVPVQHWIHGIDKKKAFDFVKEAYAGSINKILVETGYDHEKKTVFLYNAVILMEGDIMIKFHYSACGILLPRQDDAFVKEFSDRIRKFREKEKKRTFEMELITSSSDGYSLTSAEIKKTRLDIGLHYEDDFTDVDKLIRTRLNKKKDKGIVLLHGLPGTGKTTYLRYLIGKLRKKVLFISPNLAQRITDPDFMQLLLNNQDSVLVIEDAENVVMDRNEGYGSGVSNLLNLSDGLLSDCLNIQVVCSFNTPLQNIDSALMRKGRLIACYEFGKLSVAKAQQLSDHLGKNTLITDPMTVSEIYNQEEKAFDKEKKKKIGFVIAA